MARKRLKEQDGKVRTNDPKHAEDLAKKGLTVDLQTEAGRKN
jgi:hypothetical protein